MSEWVTAHPYLTTFLAFWVLCIGYDAIMAAIGHWIAKDTARDMAKWHDDNYRSEDK